MVELMSSRICRDHSLDQQHICILREEDLQEWFQFGIHGQAIYKGWRVDPYKLLSCGSTLSMELFPLVHCVSWLFFFLKHFFFYRNTFLFFVFLLLRQLIIQLFMLMLRCARSLLRLWHMTCTTGWIREKMAPSHALNMSLSCLFQKENSGLTTISLLTMIVAFGIAEIPSWKPDRS